MSGDLWTLFLSGAEERLDDLESMLADQNRWKDMGPDWAIGRLALVEAEAWTVGADGLALATRKVRQAAAKASRTEDLRSALLAFVDTLRIVLQELAKDDADEPALAERLDTATAQVTELEQAQPSRQQPPQKQEGAFQWDPPQDERMVEAFLQECDERIEDLGTKLLDLESVPDPADLLDEIFRDMHTLKGSSAFVHLTPLNELAHAAEDLMGTLRSSGSVGRAHVDTLLAVTDAMGQILELAKQGQPIPTTIVAEGRSKLARPMTRDMFEPSAPVRQTGGPVPRHEVGQTIRVGFEKLDALLNLVGEQVVLKASLRTTEGQLEKLASALDGLTKMLPENNGEEKWSRSSQQTLGEQTRSTRELSRRLDDLLGKLEFSVAKLRDQVMQLRMVPVSRIFSKHRRTVRDLAETLGKSVRLELEGETTELDKVLVEKLDEPLVHLVRNSLDHGLETPQERTRAGKDPVGVLRLSASHRGSQFLVEVSDDGRGIDPEAIRRRAVEKGLLSADEASRLDDKRSLELLFAPGFSTAKEVTDLSGRGVGLDVVAQVARDLRGSVTVSSRVGQGTTFTITVPLTLAIRQVLLLSVAGRLVAIPLEMVSRTLRIAPSQIHWAGTGRVFGSDPAIPVLDLAAVLGLASESNEPQHLVLVDLAGERFGLTSDELAGKQEILVKSPEGLLPQLPFVAGATILDNRVVPILDLPAVVRAGLDLAPLDSGRTIPADRPKALVVDDSPAARQVVAGMLSRLGLEVTEASNGKEGLNLARSAPFDLVATDVNMPEMDGYELTKALRSSEKTAGVPIIMISIRGERIDVVRGFDAGVDAYLSKPVDESELARTVQRLMAQTPRDHD